MEIFGKDAIKNKLGCNWNKYESMRLEGKKWKLGDQSGYLEESC